MGYVFQFGSVWQEHDKLLLQDQAQVADALGCHDADALMLAVSTAGRQIAWVLCRAIAAASRFRLRPACLSRSTTSL